MAFGVKKLRRLQFGAESSAGTPVAATTYWRGTGTIEDSREVIHRNEDVGYLADVDNGYIPVTGALLALDDTEATFEQLPYLGLMGIDGTVTGSRDGTGDAYIYAFTFATTTAKTPKTFTWEGGDNEGEEEFAYGYASDFHLAGAPKEAWMMGATIEGRTVAPSTYTGSLSLPTVEEILFTKSTLAIDAVGGTLGATVVSQTLLGFDAKVKPGFQQVWTGNGETYFDFLKQAAPEIELDITFEHNDSAVAEKAAWRARTPRKLRLKATGSTFANAGTTYSVKTVMLDLAGYWSKFAKLDEQDGNDVVTGTFKATYNATASLYAVLTVVNGLAALP